jgi:dienelactone hydrolase
MSRSVLVPILLAALLAGCGGGGSSSSSSSTSTDDPLSYDGGAPIALQQGTRSERDGVVVQGISYASGDDRVGGYLVSPRSTTGKLPAVVFLHGAGGDREEQLGTAVKLAKRGAIALTITAPSGAKTPPAGATGEELVRWQGGTIAEDVIAARRAFDVLADDDRVDDGRLGLVGWSMGGRLAALVAGVDDRVRATVLMSAGAAPVDAYVQGAPAELQDVVREVLEPIDPLTRVADANGVVLVQAGRQDSIVPRAALEAVIAAAPKGTKVEWYPTDHALNAQAESDRLDWLAGELGAQTGQG